MNATGVIPSTVQVIVNGASGEVADCESRRVFADRIERAFPGAGVVFTPKGADIALMAREAVKRGAGLILAGGGDGTVSAAASAVIGTDTVLGVLPLGTLNHFAKDLGLPPDLGHALSALRRGTVKPVDVGEVNGRFFLNNSGLGLYPLLVRLREVQQSRGISKWPAMFLAALQALSRYPLLTVRVTAEGQRFVRTTPVVFVGNNEYILEGLNIGARARLNAGWLFLLTLSPGGRAGLLRFFLRALLGSRRRSGDFDIRLAEELRIESRHRRVLISLDGEIALMTTPLRYRIHPGALHVLVPQAEL